MHGLHVKEPMNLGRLEMIKMPSCEDVKKNSKRKKNKRGKSKFKGECIQRRQKISIYYTMNWKRGDLMKPRKSRALMNLIMKKRILLYNNYSTRRLKSCNKLIDLK